MRISDWSSDVCSADLAARGVDVVIIAAEALAVDIDRGRKADEGALRDRGAIFDRRRDDPASVAARDVLERDDARAALVIFAGQHAGIGDAGRSEEHTSELQSLMRISYAVFCLNNKNTPLLYKHIRT